MCACFDVIKGRTFLWKESKGRSMVGKGTGLKSPETLRDVLKGGIEVR